jgi:hypothetical protein
MAALFGPLVVLTIARRSDLRNRGKIIAYPCAGVSLATARSIIALELKA